IHDHLTRHARNVRRLRHYVCPGCGEPVESRHAIDRRLEAGHTTVFCAVCGSVVPLADLIEEHLGSNDVRQRVQEMGEQVTLALDNESRELILMGHALAITAEAGQLFRTYSNSDYGIDAEIEFKDEYGRASGQRLYLVLKAGGLLRRKGRELFKI